MNASSDKHDPTKPHDLPDRLVDLALSELIGGNSPPDLSSRIAAATFRQPAAPKAVGQVPRTRQDRAFWVNLAIAVMLLIGVTVVLLPQGFSSREHSSIVANRSVIKESVKQDRLGNAVAQASKTSSTQELPKAWAKPPQPNSIAPKQLEELTQRSTHPTEVARSFSAGDPTQPRTSTLSLGIPATQNAPEAVAQAGTRRAGPEGSRPATELYVSLDSTAGPGLQPAAGDYGIDTSAPNQKSVRLLAGDSRADGLHAYGEVASKVDAPKAGFQMQNRYAVDNLNSVETAAPGLAHNAIVDAPSTNQSRLGYDWKDANGRDPSKLNELGVPFISAGTTQEGIGPGNSGDKYTQIVENPFIKAEGGAAVSTFSIDVDTASYANVRQFLLQMNQLPPPDAVRIEELINYFHYDYAGPPPAPGSAGGSTDAAPFAAHVEVTSCPWAAEHRLARIGIKGREMDRNKRPQSNLVFLVDVSGSMNEPAKLPLVVYGLEQLTRELGENDHIAIVVYAGTEGLVLPSTSGSKQDTILAALAKLQAGGSTAGGAGIQLAYQIAEDNFIKGGTNRVILCTDGDFNVGVTNTADLQRLVEKKAKDTGVFISTLGFGRGNLNDAMMVAISDHGNGNYHYIDNRTEARRVLVEEMTGTLVTIAKDVKIQVEFNPTQVAAYRLIGYEKRALRTEDFNDDKKDAGEIGAGHTVTALYEIVPASKKVEIAPVDDLKYQTAVNNSDELKKLLLGTNKELLTLKMRYKAPDGDTSKKLEWPITDDGKSFAAASGDLKFAASVAGFGLMLRNSQYKGNLTYAATLELAQGGIGEDPHGYRKEFLDMVRKAKELRHE